MLAFLDLPHYMYMYMKKLTSKYSDELEDDWFFDLGYHYAFSVSTFIITLIFSSSAPLLPIFGTLFFSIKYLVDKYNLTTTYTNEFESSGELAASVTKYVAFGIFLFQLSMCGLFTSLINAGDLALASVIVVSGEVLYMMVFKFLNTAELEETFTDILEDTEYEENFISIGSSTKVQRIKKSNLTDQQREMLKKAYYHPFEKYEEKEIALKLNKDIKKEIKQMIDSFPSTVAGPMLEKGLSVIQEREEEQSFMQKKNTLSRKRVTLKNKRDW